MPPPGEGIAQTSRGGRAGATQGIDAADPNLAPEDSFSPTKADPEGPRDQASTKQDDARDPTFSPDDRLSPADIDKAKERAGSEDTFLIEEDLIETAAQDVKDKMPQGQKHDGTDCGGCNKCALGNKDVQQLAQETAQQNAEKTGLTDGTNSIYQINAASRQDQQFKMEDHHHAADSQSPYNQSLKQDRITEQAAALEFSKNSPEYTRALEINQQISEREHAQVHYDEKRGLVVEVKEPENRPADKRSDPNNSPKEEKQSKGQEPVASVTPYERSTNKTADPQVTNPVVRDAETQRTPSRAAEQPPALAPEKPKVQITEQVPTTSAHHLAREQQYREMAAKEVSAKEEQVKGHSQRLQRAQAESSAQAEKRAETNIQPPMQQSSVRHETKPAQAPHVPKYRSSTIAPAQGDKRVQRQAPRIQGNTKFRTQSKIQLRPQTRVKLKNHQAELRNQPRQAAFDAKSGSTPKDHGPRQQRNNRPPSHTAANTPAKLFSSRLERGRVLSEVKVRPGSPRIPTGREAYKARPSAAERSSARPARRVQVSSSATQRDVNVRVGRASAATAYSRQATVRLRNGSPELKTAKRIGYLERIQRVLRFRGAKANANQRVQPNQRRRLVQEQRPKVKAQGNIIRVKPRVRAAVERTPKQTAALRRTRELVARFRLKQSRQSALEKRPAAKRETPKQNNLRRTPHKDLELRRQQRKTPYKELATRRLQKETPHKESALRRREAVERVNAKRDPHRDPERQAAKRSLRKGEIAQNQPSKAQQRKPSSSTQRTNQIESELKRLRDLSRMVNEMLQLAEEDWLEAAQERRMQRRRKEFANYKMLIEQEKRLKKLRKDAQAQASKAPESEPQEEQASQKGAQGSMKSKKDRKQVQSDVKDVQKVLDLEMVKEDDEKPFIIQ